MNNKNVDFFLKRILKEFPEFTKEMNPDIYAYDIFGDFGIYIRNKIDSNSISEIDLVRIFNFLNEMGESEDDKVQNLLTVGVLEILTDSQTAMKIAKQHLKNKALKNLISIYKYWYE